MFFMSMCSSAVLENEQFIIHKLIKQSQNPSKINASIKKFS